MVSARSSHAQKKMIVFVVLLRRREFVEDVWRTLSEKLKRYPSIKGRDVKIWRRLCRESSHLDFQLAIFVTFSPTLADKPHSKFRQPLQPEYLHDDEFDLLDL